MLVLVVLAQPGLEAVTTAQITSLPTVSAGIGTEVNFWLKLHAERVERKTDLSLSFRFNSESDRLAMIFGAPLFATITVNGTADGTLATLAGNATCDLREAIQAANTNASVGQCAAGSVGLDTIQFNLGAGTPTINLVSALPTITQQLTINGNTGGATRIELNGTAAGVGTVGLDITSGGSAINDLVINRFSGVGIRMQNGSGNVVQRCLIGTNAAGTAAAANGNVGIFILNSSGHTIGGVSGAGNVISGNAFEGIIISGAAAVGNQILGNRIGTDITGNTAVGNGQSGISLISAPSNTIGSLTAGNQISGNVVHGISIIDSDGTQIFGNRIGLNQNANAALPNSFDGIYISESNNTVIGGMTAGTGNVISGNGQHGIEMLGMTSLIAAPATSGNIVQGNLIGVDPTGAIAIPNVQDGILLDGAAGNTIGGLTTVARNYISGNGGNGIRITGSIATGNQVQGNFIGVNFAGMAALGNGGMGVRIDQAANNLIGGTTTGAGNVISGNTSIGIQISATTGTQVQGNIIGLDAAGNGVISNALGVSLASASGNTIGGTAAGSRNVISGNLGAGLRILASPVAAGNNTVSGNFIGTDGTGANDRGNGGDGVLIDVAAGQTATNNLIGGIGVAARNVISGNSMNGIRISGVTATANLVQGNFVGLDAGGTMRIANSDAGVLLLDAPSNLIGGTATGAGNVISGNSDSGIAITNSLSTGNQVQGNLIGTNAAGTAGIGNMFTGIDVSSANNNIIGGTAAGARNVISGNGSDQSGGVSFSDGASGNQVLGNFIGTDITGGSTLGNSLFGVRVFNSAVNNVIGGTTVAARNVISGNDGPGVFIQHATTTGNQILGNYIGLNTTGLAATPNTVGGVSINGAVNNTIGGATAGAGNIISGNMLSGISINAGASGNQVLGNLVGLNGAGMALPNSNHGVVIDNSPSNIIGGTVSGARNVISGNTVDGIRLLASGTTNTQILGNFIGLNLGGTAGIGNGGNGIFLDAANNNSIGNGTTAGGNVISANNGNGIFFVSTPSGNQIRGNLIGTDALGTGSLGNTGSGIDLNGSNNTVGGAGTAANTIAFNLGKGISVSIGTGNRITQNSIFSNDSRGIDLANDGLTANDAGDSDTGPNNLQNFPVLVSVSSAGVISGSLDSLAGNSAYPVRIEFFANTTLDGCTNGEGETFLGFTTLAAPGAFSATVALVPGKNLISATAIDNNGNTSEFSVCRRVNTAPTITAAAPLSRGQGSLLFNSQIATVSDADQAFNTLMVSATILSGTGVTVNNIVISNAGVVTADVVASCTATNSTFTLTVTDNVGETATATLTVNVTPNTPPTLGVYPATNIATVGGSDTVTPGAAPSDNGTIVTLTAVAPGFTGTLTGNPATGVISVTNAGPVGSYTVTVTATDNCGATTTTTFTLSVACAPLTVNSLADTPDANVSNGICADASGNCTLRAAIEEANVQNCGNIINFSVNGTIQLGSALPALAANITLNGPGASLLTVRRNTGGNYGIFAINPSRTVTISGLTVSDGNAVSGGGVLINSGSVVTLNSCVVTNNTAQVGAGIFNFGASLTITNSAITANNATAGNGVVAIGGGLDSLGGVINISNTTFSGNTNLNPLGVMQGSAMNLQDVTATLTNCTISGNQRGNIIGNLAATSASTVTMTNCTVANNASDLLAIINTGGSGGFQATTQLRNTLVAANSGQPNFRVTGTATLTSLGNNLDSDGSSGFTNGAGGNIVGTPGNPINARLAPLADNGGPTLTHALRCDSPAIDAGTVSGAPVADQRGQSRNQDGNGDNVSAVDIGALESQKYLVTNTANSGAGSLRQALLDNDGFGGGLIAFNIPGGGVQTIAPSTSFSLFKTANLDAYTQPGGSRNTLAVGNNAALTVELNGASAGSGAGFVLTPTASCSCVRGLVINRYSLGGAMIVQGSDNWINGNFIGTNPAGTAAAANQTGVQMAANANNNLIGTNADGISDPAERNLISGQNVGGVEIQNTPAVSNIIAGNYIGTNAAGTAAIPNGRGIFVSGAGVSNTIIGGSTIAARNVISGNLSSGGVFISANATNTAVQGNYIGVAADGVTALGNQGAGVRVSPAINSLIGGTSASLGNIIAFNQQIGVTITGGTGNRVFGNSVFSNTGLGIDLGTTGVTPNDTGDADTGANNLQNFPLLTSVTGAGVISGSLDSIAGDSVYPVRIEFFGNSACDTSGNGEGQGFLGATTINVPGSFSFNAGSSVASFGNFITATATDANGNTSEFSFCRAINTAPGIVAIANSRQQGSPIANTQIATVTDPDQPLNTLTVQVNGAASATVNGVTVSNLTINAGGQVFADIIASCTATNASFTLRATDNEGEFNFATLNVTTTANTAPVLSYAGPQTVLAGQNLTVNPASVPSDNGSITNIVVQSPGTYIGGITVNPTTGVVSVTGALPPGSHLITIRATDNCGATTDAAFTLNVNCPTITVNPTSLPGGTVGTGYSQTISATPAASYSFAVSAGSLPQGLTLNPTTGALTGTPTQAGTFNFTVTATSTGPCTGSQAYSVTIVCPTITVNPSSLPNGTTGTTYSQTLSATGGTAPYSFAVTGGALPAGLTLSGAGNLTGTPTQSGTFNFTVTATDANGCTGNRAYTLVIGCPPFAVVVNQPATVNAGQNFSVDITVTNPCPDASLDTTLTASTPPNTTFQGMVIPAGWICTTPPIGGTGAISCTNSSFAPRQNASRATSVFTITFGVGSTVPGGTVITTSINVNGTAAGRPPVVATGSASSTVANQAGLSVAQTAPATAVSGGNATFNIAVANGGPSPATAVVLTGAVPANTTFQSLTTPAGWTCSAPAVGGTGAITCNVATLPANQTANFTLTVRLNPTVPCDTAISNTATVQSSTSDSTPADNSATATLLAKTQADLSVSVVAPTTAVPDQSAIYTVTVTNAGPSVSFNTTLNNALPSVFSAEAATPSTGTCTGIGTNAVNCNLGTLAVGATATIRIQAHVPETCQPAAAVNLATVASGNCLTDPATANNTAQTTTTVQLANLGAGACLPAKSAISATKPGSLLLAGLFTSSASGAGGSDPQNNTRVNLTNVHPQLGVVVHLFFVDGDTCTISDAFVCLTANQTTSFFMSDLDPGTRGYMLMTAVDGPPGFAGGNNTGCPISFNYLIGNANIKYTGSPRRDLDLESEGVGAEFGSPVPGCDPTSSTAELVFDGSPTGYNQLPAVLAADNIPSRADGNDTQIAIARVDGNWGTGIRPIGPIFGILYNDTESATSFSFNVGTCLFRQSINNSFPRTTPRFEQFVPAGRSAWMKFWSTDGAALVGVMHNRNDNSQSSPGAFEGGHNLHVLRLLPRATIIVPVFPPSC